MTKLPRWFAKEFARDRWHVCDRECWNIPLHDDSPYGNDKPRVFDEDAASELVSRMNEEEDWFRDGRTGEAK